MLNALLAILAALICVVESKCHQIHPLNGQHLIIATTDVSCFPFFNELNVLPLPSIIHSILLES